MDNFVVEKITVAVLTCRRNAPLRRLLASFCELEWPPRTDVSFLIVDNDPAGSAYDTVLALQSKFSKLRYVLERQPGIPAARNRAIEEVLKDGADFMAFTDDDEVVEKSWLRELVSVQRQTQADLVGGPELGGKNSEQLSFWNKLVETSVIHRAKQKAKKAEMAAERSNESTVLTHNWYCNVQKLRETNLRFDLACTNSGGSDTVFANKAKSLGWTNAWAPNAIVREILPAERLTLGYQLRRGQEQSVAHYLRKVGRPRKFAFVRVMPAAIVRIVSGCLLFLIPFKGLASPVIAVRSIGWGIGRILAANGKTGSLYSAIIVESGKAESAHLAR